MYILIFTYSKGQQTSHVERWWSQGAKMKWWKVPQHSQAGQAGANGENGRGKLDRRAWRRHGGCGAPSATRAAAASHGTSDAFVIQMHFMSCLKGVFEMLMAFHQQWWMDILPIMDKLASATYPLHTYYLQFYLLLKNLWVGILWPPNYLQLNYSKKVFFSSSIYLPETL